MVTIFDPLWTSTGGILAIGLGLGLSAKQMLEFYRPARPDHFPNNEYGQQVQTQRPPFLRPKYSQEVLLRELEAAYYVGKKPVSLNESKCRLLILSLSCGGGFHRIIFRTPHHPLLTGDAKTETAYAHWPPPPHPHFLRCKSRNMIAESTFFDGGVWANSPALAAIVETTCFLNVPLDRIDVLSVGTTDEPFTVRKQARSGILPWSKKLVGLLMTAQAEVSQKTCQGCLLENPVPSRERDHFTRQLYPRQPTRNRGIGGSRKPEKGEEPEVLSQVRSRFLNGVLAAPWERFG